MSINEAERRILMALQTNGRISNVDLAEEGGLSESASLRRVRQLEETGLIKGYGAFLDQKKAGFDVVAYIQINLDQHSETETKRFLKAVEDEPRIIACYAMSGAFDYLVKVVTSDLDEYGDLAMRKILRFPGVKDISSSFVLDEVKNTHALPL